MASLHLMIEITTILSLGIWCWLLTMHGHFWCSKPVLDKGKRPTGKAKIAVVIPARDEADHIHQVLTSLLAQDYDGEFVVILVDDNSTDATRRIAQGLAQSDPRLTVLTGKPLEAGWSGKLWAVSQGLQHPAVMQAAFVLLTDADITHDAGHISALVAKAEYEGLDLVSEMVRLNCRTISERALIPAFVFFFQMLYPFAWVNNPTRKTAAGAGGTMLVSQAALTRIDGVNRIRHHLIDDVALARAIKQKGKIWLGHSERASSLRVYAEAGEIWNMIARTAYVQLCHSPLLLLIACIGMLLVFVAPPLLLFAPGWPSLLAAITWSMMAFTFLPTLRRYRLLPLWSFALPAISLFYLGATLASAIRHYQGKGGAWKDRVYPETTEL
jgi:hopene-associated glycosyltransferase HpnB